MFQPVSAAKESDQTVQMKSNSLVRVCAIIYLETSGSIASEWEDEQ